MTATCPHLRQVVAGDDGGDMGKHVLVDVVLMMPCAHPGCPMSVGGADLVVADRDRTRRVYGRAACRDGHWRWFPR